MATRLKTSLEYMYRKCLYYGYLVDALVIWTFIFVSILYTEAYNSNLGALHSVCRAATAQMNV